TEVAAAEEILEADLLRVTNTPALESTPTLGRDVFSDLVVFSRRLPSGGDADIQYTRIVDGLPTPRAITIPGPAPRGSTDDLLNDLDGSRVVFSAYSNGLQGSVVLYDIESTQQFTLGQANELFEARVYGDWVIWHESTGSDPRSSRVQLINLVTGIVTTLLEAEFVLSVDVDTRYAVYSFQAENGFGEARAYDLETGESFVLPETPNASNLVPRTFESWVTWQVSDLFGNESIQALNLETGEQRTVTEGQNVFRPTINGDLIAYETDGFGNDVDVAVYRISTDETFAVTNLPGDQFLTDVFDSRVAFLDNAEGQDDVYYANLRFVVPPPPYECPSDDAQTLCDLECAPVELNARKSYRPSRWLDGEACLCRPTEVTLPLELTVTSGNAGNHWADVFFEDGDTEVLCRYRGGSDQSHPDSPEQVQKGTRYLFDFCTDGTQPGDVVTTQFLRVFVANGDSRAQTSVRAQFEQFGCGTVALDSAPQQAVVALPAPNSPSGCTGAGTTFLFVLLLGVRRRR
ncbi:MAG: hypothetical protein AAFQ82_06300, partial [Myxococcota bacterium]